MKVPFIDLKTQYHSIKNEIDEGINDTIERSNFILGKNVLDFEKSVKKYLGIDSIGVASGSDALLLALMGCNIKEGDEVITTPFTFFATAGSIARLGAKPVFVDIDEKTFNIDPEKIKQSITSKTKAIIVVHIFGQMADMDKIKKVVKDLPIIEDACQAIGSKYKDKMAGTMGRFGCFSFFPTKNLGAYGDGGLITCKGKDYELIKKLRVHGSEKKYFHDHLGFNSRLDSLQAKILEIKLQYLDEWNNRRREIAKQYDEELKNYVKIPYVSKDSYHVYHQYAILVKNRDKLIEFLKDKGIAAAIYYPLPLHLQKVFSDLRYKQGDFEICEKISEQILSIPIYPDMSDEMVKYVIKNIKEFIRP